MSTRKLLLSLGILLVLAGVGLYMSRLNQVRMLAAPPAADEKARPAMLTALRRLPSGTLLRQGDFGWRDIPEGEVRPGRLLRGQVMESEFFGAIVRRDFAEGEPLMASDLVKPGDRQFLSAVLRPGHLAMSIPVDAPQSSSGLVLPGDYVDVVLTQRFEDKETALAYRSVSETVVRNVRVVATDQSLGSPTKPGPEGTTLSAETKIPRTMSLELDREQAQTLSVAMQIGKLALLVHPLEGKGSVELPNASLQASTSTWASDVSPALKAMALVSATLAGNPCGHKRQLESTNSSIVRNIRWAPCPGAVAASSTPGITPAKPPEHVATLRN